MTTQVLAYLLFCSQVPPCSYKLCQYLEGILQDQRAGVGDSPQDEAGHSSHYIVSPSGEVCDNVLQSVPCSPVVAVNAQVKPCYPVVAVNAQVKPCCPVVAMRV